MSKNEGQYERVRKIGEPETLSSKVKRYISCLFEYLYWLCLFVVCVYFVLSVIFVSYNIFVIKFDISILTNQTFIVNDHLTKILDRLNLTKKI